jgi:transposase
MAEHRPAYDELSREQLIAALTERDRQLAEATARIAALEAQVRELMARLGPKATPQNSSLPPAKADKPNRRERPAKGKPKRPGFFRRELHPDPDRVVECQVAACRRCGCAELALVAVREHDCHELVEKPVRVTRVRRAVCACARCGTRTVAESPAGLGPADLVGPRLRGFLVLLRHHLDAPYRRLRLMITEALGLRLSEGFLVATVERAAADLAPAVDAIEARIRAAAVVLSDETGLRIDGRNGWVWLFRTTDAIRYLVAERRAKAVVEGFLAGASPEVWVSDRYGGQRGFGAERQACLAHLRRDCRAAVERGDTVFAAALEQAVLAILQADRRKPCWSDATLAERRRTLEHRLDAIAALEPLHPDGATLRRWLKAHRSELTLCLRRRDVPATNNASERALRPVVTAQKVFGGLRSWSGAQALAGIRSVIATARARGLSAMEGLAIALAGKPLPPGPAVTAAA